MNKLRSFVKIGEAAEKLGVSIDTLRRWEKAGKIEVIRTPGGTRLYSISSLEELIETPLKYHRASVSLPGGRLGGTKPALTSTVEDLINNLHSETSTKQEPTAEFIDTRKLEPEEVMIFSEAELSSLRGASETSDAAIYHGRSSRPRLRRVLRMTTSKIYALTALSSVLATVVVAFLLLSGFSGPQDLTAKLAQVFNPNHQSSIINQSSTLSPQVLAAATADYYLDINSDVAIEGDLAVAKTINGLTLAPNSDGFSIAGGTSANRKMTVVGGDVTLDQDVSTKGSPSFTALKLTSTTKQIAMGGAGTLTWTPTGTQTITFPNATGNVLLDTATQTITNKTISGSSNTFSSIPNSALSSSTITVTAGTNMSGGGAIALGGSATLSLKGDISLTSVIATGDVSAATLTGTSYLTLSQTTAPTTTTDKLYNVAGTLIWNGSSIYRVGGTDIAVADGGTGKSSWTQYSIPYLTDTTTFGEIAIGTTAQVLATTGTGYDWVDLSSISGVTGTGTTGSIVGWTGTSTVGNLTDLPTATTIGSAYIYRVGGTDVSVADGGTGKSAWDQYGLVYADTTTSLSQVGLGTTGQILAYNGAGSYDFVNLSDLSGVTGIGTSNYVAKWSGTSTLTTGTLWDDGTNVGIGTTNPGSKLEVNGDVKATTFNGNTITTGTGTLTMAAGKTVSFADAFTTTGSFPLTLTTTASTTATLPSGTITLADLGTTQTFTATKTFSNATYSALFTGGNVGIGTTAPSQAFSVANLFTVDSTGTVKAGIWDGTDIAVTAGGTNKSAWTQYSIPYLTDTTTFGEIAIGTTAQVLATTGTGYDWVDLSSISGVTGTGTTGSIVGWTGTSTVGNLTDLPTATTIGSAYIYRVGGTDVSVADGGTGLSTVAAGSILAANTLDTLTAITSTSGTKVLKNVDGTVSWDSVAGTGGVTGTGTSNYVAKWSGTSTLTTGTLWDDGTNVGIGTTSPASPVAVGTTLTSGTILSIAYNALTSLAGDLIGEKIDLNDGLVTPTNQNVTGLRVVLPTTTNTHTSGTKTLAGMSLGFGAGVGINQNGAGGTTTYNGIDLTLPALTETAGTLTGNGVLITTPSSITTGGTANGINISPTGVGAGTLNGINIGTISSPLAGTETAINVGTGWDNVLKVGSTAIINGSGVTQVAGGGTGIASYTLGDLLYASDTTTLTKIGIGTTNQVLAVVTGIPAWSTITGSSCTDCVVNDPTSVATQTITPNNQDISSLIVRQTTYATPTQNIFEVTDKLGTTKYFYVDSSGNVSTGGIASQTLTLTPTSDTTALTLVGTNVSTANLQYINSKNLQGTILNIAYGAAATLNNNQTLTGQAINLSTNVTANASAPGNTISVTGQSITLPAPTNTNTTGTNNLIGLAVTAGSGINQNGTGGTTIFSGVDVTIPALTQTAGTLTGNGVLVTTPSSITTGGTANGINISPTGVGAGTLNGINIGTISSPGVGVETALNIGTGWDYGIYSQTTGINYFAGNVGIGTTNPSATLDLVGTLQYTDGNQGLNKVLTSDASGNATWTSLAGAGGVTGIGTSNYVAKWSGTSTLTTGTLWDDGTNVGIGTTAPNAPLQVNGNINATTFNSLTITGNGTNTLNIAAGKTLRANDSTTFNTDTLTFGGTEILTLANGKNVTFADAFTTSGSFPLTLTTTASTTATIPSGTITLADLGTTQTFTATKTFSNATYSALFTGGNVGIGTTSPLGLLHVAGQCVTGETKLKRRKRRKGKNGEWIDSWEDVEIKDIKEGDEILTLDEETGEFVTSKVKALMDMGRKDIIKITTISGKTIRTTSEHPYLIKKQEKNQIDFILNHSFKEAKKLAHDFYFGYLDKTSVKVPALNGEEVYFTREGWEHLMAEKRSTHELLTRLFTLTRVSTVLENTTHIVDHDTRMLIDKDFDVMEYWVFEEIIEGILVKVIIASYEGGPKFFLSAIWKGTKEIRGIKKELSLACNPRRRRMVTSQLFNRIIITQNAPMSSNHGKWTKVKNLQVGVKIATIDGWEEIAKIEHLPSEQVFDIEVEGTHNFVGNNIVAHNTAIFGAGEGGTPTTTTLRGAAGAGTDIAGANFTFDASNGTGTGGSGALIFRTAPVGTTGTTANTLAEIMRITPGGNVGIGTTGPNGKLDVMTGTTGNDMNILFNETASNEQKIIFQEGGLSTFAFHHNGSDSSPNNKFIIQSADGSDGVLDVNALTIQQNGNVGIGDTSPDNLLGLGQTVGTTISSADGKKFAVYNAADGTDFYGLGISAAYLQFHAGSTATEAPGMVLKNAGNVGIGTTSPGATLEVVGSIVNSGDSARLRLMRTTGANYLDFEDSNDFYIRSINTDDTNGNIRLTIDNSSGNVGIGTTSPLAKLELSDANFPPARFIRAPGAVTATYYGGSQIKLLTTSSDVNAGIGQFFAYQDSSGTENNLAAVGGIRNGADNTGDLFLYTYNAGTGSEKMRITADGNVGIGTTGPVTKLHVEGAAASNYLAYINNTDDGVSSNGLRVEVKNNAVSNTVQRWFVNNSEIMRVQANGNVGIGITAPARQTHIVANSATTNAVVQTLAIEANSTGTVAAGFGPTIEFRGEVSSGALSYRLAEIGAVWEDPTAGVVDGALVFLTRLNEGTITERVRINSTGNVGIGTTAPTSLFEVAGNGQFSNANSRVSIGGVLHNSSALIINSTNIPVSGNSAMGMRIDPTFASGTTTNAIGLEIGNQTAAAAFTTNAMYNLYISNPVKGAGSAITSNYGLYIENQTAGATNNYAIYSNGGTNYFSGNVGIGTTSPVTKLEVVNSATGLNYIATFRNSTAKTWAAATTNDNILLYSRKSDAVGDVSVATINWGLTDTVANNGGTLAFDVINTSGNWGTVMTLKGNGNVGIGTSAPVFNIDLSSDTANARLGRAEIGALPVSPGYAYFGNQDLDHTVATNYALLQAGTGETFLNAASGQIINFRINNTGEVILNTTALYPDTSDGNALGSATKMWSDLFLASGGVINWNSDVTVTHAANTLTFAGATSGYIFNDGNVGIGTTAPARALGVTGSITASAAYYSGATIGCSGTPTASTLGIVTTCSSSQRYKTNISDLNLGLDTILGLQPRTFDYKTDYSGYLPGLQIGFIAEEVEKVDPLLVNYDESGRVEGVKYIQLTAVLAKAIQEQQGQLSALNLQLGKTPDVSPSTSGVEAKVDVLGARLDAAIESQRAQIASMSAQIASISAVIASEAKQSSTSSGQIATSPTAPRNDVTVNELYLTPPETLLATSSATLTNLAVTSDATISGKLTAYSAVIQDTFKALGDTFLSNTTIAGNFTVDGTLSISGNSLSTLEDLHIQNGPLAGTVDFFNGLVTIDKTGKIVATEIEAKTITTNKLIISTPDVGPDSSGVNPASLGEATIPTGQTEISVTTSSVTDKSKIFLTPTTPTGGQAIILGGTVPGTGFVAKLDHPFGTDIKFNWIIIDTK